MKATLGRDMGKNPVQDLHWLFTIEDSNEGLYTRSEVERDPTIARSWTVQEWLGLNKKWGYKLGGGISNPEKIDTWYEIGFKGTVAIEKDKKEAIKKFHELADWLIEQGWEVHKTAGRA